MAREFFKSLAFSFLTLFFGFLAVIVTFMDEAFSGSFSIIKLLRDGELIIICISLIINSIYILYNLDKKGKTFPHIAFWASLIFYTLSFASYILITNNHYENLDYLVYVYSIIMTIFVFLITAYTHYIQNLNPEVTAKRTKDKITLADKFTKMRGK